MKQEQWKKYSEDFGVRFSKRDKQKFQKQLIEDYKELGYTCEIIQGKRFLSKASNLMFGNIKHAKTVIAIPYDTPQKVFWPSSYFYPLDGMATTNKSLIPVFGPVLIIYLLLLFLMNSAGSFTDSLTTNTMLMFTFLIIILVLFYVMLHGVRNKNNYTRNSASIYAAYEIASALDKDTRRQVAFLFLDMNKSRHLGAKVAAEDFLKQSKNPNVIVLNAFASGSQLQIGYRAQNKKMAQDLNKGLANAERLKMIALSDEMRNSSPMEHFQKAVTIGAGEIDKKGRLCVLHTGTRKDNQIDEGNIEKVISLVINFVK